MATLPKVLISRADYQIGGGVALGLRTQASVKRLLRIVDLLAIDSTISWRELRGAGQIAPMTPCLNE